MAGPTALVLIVAARGAADVILEQLRGGMAWWDWEYAKEQPSQERKDSACEEYNAKVVTRAVGTDAKYALSDPIDQLGWQAKCCKAAENYYLSPSNNNGGEESNAASVCGFRVPAA
jgi:hypothetical protein